MKNQTAVEWLEQEFEKYLGWSIEGDYKASEYTATDFSNALEQAKQMEEEQMKRMYVEGAFAQMRYFDGKEFINAEQYYNETFKKEE